MSASVPVRLLAIATLLAIYLLTLGSVALGDISIGLVLAITMELGWRHRVARGGSIGSDEASGPPRPPLHRALLGAPALFWATFLEIARGTWAVSQYSLGLRKMEHDGIVEISLKGISEEGVAAWAFISTISPGELVLEVDEERGMLVIHTLDIRDPEAIRKRHHDFYERYQRKVVP